MYCLSAKGVEVVTGVAIVMVCRCRVLVVVSSRLRDAKDYVVASQSIDVREEVDSRLHQWGDINNSIVKWC